MDEELTESLWVRIKRMAGTGDITVGICYRPPDQEDLGSLNLLFLEIVIVVK